MPLRCRWGCNVPRDPSWWYAPPGGVSRALMPVAQMYGAVAARRLAPSRIHKAALPVICVGNFTAGGSGKTPFALMLAKRLIAGGDRPVFLTRGYGGSVAGPHWVDPDRDTAAVTGDEPLLLARVAPVLICRDRVAGADVIAASGRASVIVMDDGLQNGRLAKDLTFAVVDGVRGVGNGAVIPAGPLRAPLAAQGRLVQAIVFNGTPHQGLRERIGVVTAVPQLKARLVVVGDYAALSGKPVVAFAGIGNPERFFSTVRALGAQVVEAVAFPDHAPYRDTDAARLLALTARHGAQLVTTSKDAARLTGSGPLEDLKRAIHVVDVEMRLEGGDDVLDCLIASALRQ